MMSDLKSLRIHLEETCPKCLRKICNCRIIEEMKKMGWRVVWDYGFHIYPPNGRGYGIVYADEALAWNFAVRALLKEREFKKN